MANRRFLVLARVGDTSLHRNWIQGAARNFDLYLSYYGSVPGRYAGEGDFLKEAKGLKWPIVHEHLVQENRLIDQYEAVWFPDDDLLMDAAGISRMFELFMAFGFSLAQPSLTPDSYFSHSTVLRDADYIVRYTNFVEVMGPIFSQPALQLLHPTFAQSRIGWGLDYLWPHLLERDNQGHRMGLIDAVPVVHTRPVGGGDIYQGRGGVLDEDLQRLAELYPDVDFSTRSVRSRFAIWGGVREVGPRPRLSAVAHGRWHRFWAKRKARMTPKYRR